MPFKIQFLVFVLLFKTISGIAQDSTADKIKADIEAAKEDTLKVNLLIRMGRYLLNSTPEQATPYGMQALDLAQKVKFPMGRANAYKTLGMINYYLGNTIATLDYFSQALHVYDSIGYEIGKAKMLNNIGNTYLMNGTNEKALEYFFKSLEVAEKISDKEDIATTFVNIGNIYSYKRATSDKALEFFLKALAISEEIGDKNVIGSSSVNIGEHYLNSDNDDSAVYFFNKSLDAYANTINIPYPLRDMGMYFEKKGDFKKAIQYYQQSYQTAKQFDSKLDMTQTLKVMGDTYFKQKDYVSALITYKHADSIAAEIPAFKELNDSYAGIASTYFKMGKLDSAFHYQKLFSDLSDTINNQMLTEKSNALQKSFEVQSRQNSINLLTKDKELQELDLKRQKLQKTVISGGLALILLIALIILRNYLQTAKTNKLLDKQKVQIENLLENILPAEVAKELQRDGKATPRYYESVTVLFTDFKDFTRHADTLSPQEIVSELNACFIAFDDIIEKYNLEKIKTIGDSYMCAGGIPTENDSHTLNMIHASLEIQAYMESRNSERINNGLQAWNIRIGVHVGPVVAGVVGRKKYAYDIWGGTVNIASRMESNGEPGMVNISAQTYELIKNEYTCVHRGKIFAKNIGEIDMYFVNEKIVYLPENLHVNKGNPDFAGAEDFILSKLKNELPAALLYHNLDHTLDVLNVAMEIGEAQHVSAEEMKIVRIAALYHDAGFIHVYKNHEEKSCDMAREYLPSFDFSPGQISLICDIVMTTKVPQSPISLLEQIMVDADLDYLGRDDVYDTAQKLFEEMQLHNLMPDEKQWIPFQIEFLQQHDYFTAFSKKRRGPKKNLYLKHLMAQV